MAAAVPWWAKIEVGDDDGSDFDFFHNRTTIPNPTQRATELAAAAATQPQEKPRWAKVDVGEEYGSDLEFRRRRTANPNPTQPTAELTVAAAVATQPQVKPRLGKVEIGEEDRSDLDLLLLRSRLIGIEDGGLSKAIECRKAIEDRFDDRGSEVKMTSITRARKPARSCLSRTVERRSWSKFGEALEDDASSQVTTSSSEEILLERPQILGSKVDELAAFGDPLAMLASKGDAFLMVCRTCGEKGDHWTFRCHLNSIGAKIKRCPLSNDPPLCEVCMEPVDDVTGHWKDGGHDTTIRVTNLSKDISERDLANLCCIFGLLVHISLAVDEDSDSSRQFGIVQFGRSHEAEDAISRLAGYKYKGLMFGVEWAKPKGEDVPPMCPSCMQATENWVRVTNLPEDTEESDLYDLFCNFGSVNRARLFVDKKTGSHRQVGIVEFVKRERAEWCSEFLNGLLRYNSRSLIVEGPFELQDVQRDLGM